MPQASALACGALLAALLHGAAAAQTIPLRAHCPDESADDYFFLHGSDKKPYVRGEKVPDPALDVNVLDGEFRARWYSNGLRPFREPPMSCGEWTGENYRFVWLRSFDPAVFVRVARDGDHRTLRAGTIRYGALGGGEEVERVQRDLSQEEWGRLIAAVQKDGFWRRPPPALLPLSRLPGPKDGARWIVEGVKDQRYRLVARHSPMTRNPDFAAIGLLLLELSGLAYEGRVY